MSGNLLEFGCTLYLQATTAELKIEFIFLKIKFLDSNMLLVI